MYPKKVYQTGDPVHDALRSSDMLTSSSPVEEVDASAAGGAILASAQKDVPKRRTGKRMVASTTETDWTGHMARIRDQRDQAAFAELFRHFAPRVKAFLMKGGASEPLAEECMQEAMATVWRKVELFDPARASAATWIFTIARNRRIDVLRRERRPEPEDLPWGPEAEPDQEDVLALQQDSARLAAALGQLPQKQRELIEAAYFGDLSHSQIAAETGLPLGTIKSRIRLALERLRHAMK